MGWTALADEPRRCGVGSSMTLYTIDLATGEPKVITGDDQDILDYAIMARNEAARDPDIERGIRSNHAISELLTKAIELNKRTTAA